MYKKKIINIKLTIWLINGWSRKRYQGRTEKCAYVARVLSIKIREQLTEIKPKTKSTAQS